MNTIDKLAEIFSKFPGIGSRQSRRFVYFLLRQNTSFVTSLIKELESVQKDIFQCDFCQRFFHNDNSNGGKLCEICSNSQTDKNIILVVEKDSDFENIQKSKTYNGRFFILGGLLPILEQNPDSKIRARKLFEIVKEEIKNSQLKEIILALPINSEGENTVNYLTKILEPLKTQIPFKITTLGRGLSTGAELEYSDSATLKNALNNRQ